MSETRSIQVQKWTRSPPPSLKSIRSEIWCHCIINPWPLKGSPPGLYSVIIILLCKGLCLRNVFSGGRWGRSFSGNHSYIRLDGPHHPTNQEERWRSLFWLCLSILSFIRQTQKRPFVGADRPYTECCWWVLCSYHPTRCKLVVSCVIGSLLP